MSHSAEARVGLEQTFFRVTEGVGVFEVCFVVFEPDIECPIKFPFNVQLVTADGTAGIVIRISNVNMHNMFMLLSTVENRDYRPIDAILMFDECERQRCVNIAIIQDLVGEVDESFTFHMRRTVGLSHRILLDPEDGVIELLDDDGEECILSFTDLRQKYSLIEASKNIYTMFTDFKYISYLCFPQSHCKI